MRKRKPTWCGTQTTASAWTFVRTNCHRHMGADDATQLRSGSWMRRLSTLEASIFQPGVVVIDEHNGLSNTLVEQTKAFYRPKGEAVLKGEELAVSPRRRVVLLPVPGWRADAIVGTGFREGLNVIQDMALILDITMRGGLLYYDPQVAFMYRRHGGSDSSRRAPEGNCFEEERRYYNTMVEEMSALGWKKAARVARIRFLPRLRADPAAEGGPGEEVAGREEPCRARGEVNPIRVRSSHPTVDVRRICVWNDWLSDS